MAVERIIHVERDRCARTRTIFDECSRIRAAVEIRVEFIRAEEGEAIAIVDDGREMVWVSGLKGAVRVIVVGQDFVKDGGPVEAVSAAEAEPAAPKTEPPV